MGNGPASPGRWQVVQFWKTIGAICSENVTDGFSAGVAAMQLPAISVSAPAQKRDFMDLVEEGIGIAVSKMTPGPLQWLLHSKPVHENRHFHWLREVLPFGLPGKDLDGRFLL